MIFIDRGRATAPRELVVGGAARLAEHRLNPPRRSDEFDRDVYGSEQVKSALHEMQHAKCCYCEKDCERWHEDVDHFRPKTEAVRGSGVIDEGYWWLAYAFHNLLFACRQCNRTKGSRFPLAPRARALVPEEDPATTPERALLLDPTRDRPEDHLTFLLLPGRGYQVAPRNASVRGRETIEVLGLDRDDLTAQRLRYHRLHLAPLLKRFQGAHTASDIKALSECRASAAKLVAPDAPFSLFSRSVLADAGLLTPPASPHRGKKKSARASASKRAGPRKKRRMASEPGRRRTQATLE